MSGLASEISRPIFLSKPWWSSQLSNTYLSCPGPLLLLTLCVSRHACVRTTISLLVVLSFELSGLGCTGTSDAFGTSLFIPCFLAFSASLSFESLTMISIYSQTFVVFWFADNVNFVSCVLNSSVKTAWKIFLVYSNLQLQHAAKHEICSTIPNTWPYRYYL